MSRLFQLLFFVLLDLSSLSLPFLEAFPFHVPHVGSSPVYPGLTTDPNAGQEGRAGGISLTGKAGLFPLLPSDGGQGVRKGIRELGTIQRAEVAWGRMD